MDLFNNGVWGRRSAGARKCEWKWVVREVGGELRWPSKRSRKKHEDPPEGMYEEVDDSERGETDM